MQGLYRSTQNRKLAEFLARDFQEEQHCQAAQVGALLPAHFGILCTALWHVYCATLPAADCRACANMEAVRCADVCKRGGCMLGACSCLG